MNTLQQPLFTATPYGNFHLAEQDTTSVVVSHDDEPDLPSLSAVALPDDHPIRDLYTAPDGYGPGLYPGFVPMAHMLEQAKRDELMARLTPDEKARIWNTQQEHGGSVIHWDAESGQYLTRDCEAFSVEDVDATVRGLLEY